MSIFKTVFEQFRGVIENASNLALPTSTILTVVKTDHICGAANTVLKNYDAVWKSIVMNKNISSVLQRVSADGTLSLTKGRRFSVVLVKGKGVLY